MDVDKALLSMISNFKEKTGKSLDEWLEIARSFNTEKHSEIIKRLKTEFGLTHGYANMVAHKLKGSDAGSAEDKNDLVDQQYKGKEALKSLYDHLLSEIMKFGDDIEAAPKNAYVSIRRKKQFAILQPSTKTRLDVGLVLKGTVPSGRLEAAGSFNAMCTHRVRIESADDITGEVLDWIRNAYSEAN